MFCDVKDNVLVDRKSDNGGGWKRRGRLVIPRGYSFTNREYSVSNERVKNEREGWGVSSRTFYFDLPYTESAENVRARPIFSACSRSWMD